MHDRVDVRALRRGAVELELAGEVRAHVAYGVVCVGVRGRCAVVLVGKVEHDLELRQRAAQASLQLIVQSRLAAAAELLSEAALRGGLGVQQRVECLACGQVHALHLKGAARKFARRGRPQCVVPAALVAEVRERGEHVAHDGRAAVQVPLE